MDKNKKLFPQRLWELIHDEKYNFCLRWSPNGQRVYLNRSEFENHYLRTPNNQFHTQKAISFVRQMNMYGFRKVDDCYYENDNFKRNCHRLLKNMVRRHSNKSFYSNSSDSQQTNTNSHNNNNNNNNNNINNNINNNNNQTNHNARRPIDQLTNIPQHLCLHQRNQTFHHQQIGDATVARASLADIERQTTVAAAAAAAAHCLSNAGGTVGNIGAALAALNSPNVAAALNTTSRSPLASTLYHRLTALNFDQSNQTNDQFLQHRHQHSCQPNNPSMVAAAATNANSLIHDKLGASSQDPLNHNNNIDRALSHRITPTNQPLDLLDIQMNIRQQQSSLAAHQAAQQNLVRTFLQLKQPEAPLAVQQNLLASIHQQNPNLLIESLASLSSASQLSSTQPSVICPNVSPLELVVDPIHQSSNNLNNTSMSQQNSLIIDQPVNSTKRSIESMTRSGMSGSYKSSPFDRNQFEIKNDCDHSGDECIVDLQDRSSLARNHELSGFSSSSSNNGLSRLSREPEDLSDAILNLAKPSNMRSNGQSKTSKTSNK